jgi:hypothetical protein
MSDSQVILDKRDYDAMVEWIIDARRLLDIFVLADDMPLKWEEELMHHIDCLRQNRVI